MKNYVDNAEFALALNSYREVNDNTNEIRAILNLLVDNEDSQINTINDEYPLFLNINEDEESTCIQLTANKTAHLRDFLTKILKEIGYE